MTEAAYDDYYLYPLADAPLLQETATLLQWGPLGWWFWFGGLVAIVASVFVVAWAIFESYQFGERSGQYIRHMALPLIGLVGLLVQIPALFVPDNLKAADLGFYLGLLGIGGALFVGATMIAYFIKTAPIAGPLFAVAGGTNAGTFSDSEERRRRAEEEQEGAISIGERRRATKVRKRETTPLPDSSLDVEIDKARMPASEAFSPLVANAGDTIVDGTVVDEVDAKPGSNSEHEETGTLLYDTDDRPATSSERTIID